MLSGATCWLEPTDEQAVGLRVYTVGEGGYDCEFGAHRAIRYTGRLPLSKEFIPDMDDPAWPTECVRCGADIREGKRQPWTLPIYRSADTGEERFIHSNPDVAAPDIPIAGGGAMWNAHWMPESVQQSDGIYLMVRCPDGRDWAVDSRASNCGLPDDNEHRCWVRHGDPREARVTVDKNGLTCSVGAGSIQTEDWHGFLRDGQLVVA